MDIDFLNEYRNLPTSQLLAIVRHPQDYQPAAVQAAQTLLDARQPGPDDESAAVLQLESLAAEQDTRKRTAEQVQQGLKSFFEPVIRPDSGTSPRKWVNILILCLTLQYISILYYFISKMLALSRMPGHHYSFWDFYAVIYLLYMPALAGLLYKGRRWGWILLMVDKLYYLLNSLVSLFYVFKIPYASDGYIISHVWRVIMNGAFVLLLWRRDIADYLQISNRTGRKTVVAGSLLFLTRIILYKFIG